MLSIGYMQQLLSRVRIAHAVVGGAGGPKEFVNIAVTKTVNSWLVNRVEPRLASNKFHCHAVCLQGLRDITNHQLKVYSYS